MIIDNRDDGGALALDLDEGYWNSECENLTCDAPHVPTYLPTSRAYRISRTTIEYDQIVTYIMVSYLVSVLEQLFPACHDFCLV